jgi:preprotein translocase subunit SecD
MLQVSAWVRILVAAILIGGVVIALPNALPDGFRIWLAGATQKWPAGIRDPLVNWSNDTVSLGLDLQGGSNILLEVELDQAFKDKLDSTLGDVRRALRKAHVGYKDLATGDNGVSLTVIDPTQFDTALQAVKDLNPTVGGTVLSVGSREYDVAQPGGGRIVMTMTDTYKKQTKTDIVAQSIEVVRRRIDNLGTKEPSIEQQGEDRIVVQVPGLQDPTKLIEVLQTTAKMTFQMVDEAADVAAAKRGDVPIGDELLPVDPGEANGQETALVVEKRVLVAGDRLKDAGWTTNQQTGQVVVTFRFDNVGAKEFADVTKDNVGRRFATVLDNKIITAPQIKEPILTGDGEIEGHFTVESASELAGLLRAGALPAPLRPIEQNTVGASLGKDQIDAGRLSAVAGLIFVAVFMILRYGLFGVFADIALTFNVVLLLAILTLMDATLTLPGIAGIVLTMGMAVDANVLIYERIREEHRNGRSILASIDAGFRRAMATIFDANATHVIAAAILFVLGSGPVRGFAVTLLVGIVTSFFTAVMVTRLIVIQWLHVTRPKKLAL